MSELNQKEVMEMAIRNKDVYFMCKHLFSFELTQGQEEIVRTIAFTEHKRVSINCYTRYGKTRCVALGVAIYILINKDKKIAIIAPQQEQTAILREYIVDCIITCPALARIVELDKTRDIKSLKKEASRTRQTFSNGCEYRVFSAYGEANIMMGFGADVVIKDEAAKISRPAHAKIFRMTGDDPENAILIEITNPWDRDTVAGDHFHDTSWKQIHIGWEQGVAEGRTTIAHIEEARKELTPVEFTILYDSNYPAEAVDALLKWTWIQSAINKKISGEIVKRRIGLDVAEGGLDLSVATEVGITADKNYIVKNITDWHEADTEITVDNADNIAKKANIQYINVDATGLGKGIADGLVKRGYKVNQVKVGESPTSEKWRFMNKKAQYFWNLRTIFEDGRISIPKHNVLIKQLQSMRFETTAGEKIKIIDPGVKSASGTVVGDNKSPDFADSLTLACVESAGRILV